MVWIMKDNILVYKVGIDAIIANFVCENVNWRILTGDKQRIVVAQLLRH